MVWQMRSANGQSPRCREGRSSSCLRFLTSPRRAPDVLVCRARTGPGISMPQVPTTGSEELTPPAGDRPAAFVGVAQPPLWSSGARRDKARAGGE